MNIRETQVDKLLAAKRECDKAGGVDKGNRLLAVVRASTGYELNEAFDRSGGDPYEWSKIKADPQ